MNKPSESKEDSKSLESEHSDGNQASECDDLSAKINQQFAKLDIKSSFDFMKFLKEADAEGKLDHSKEWQEADFA